MSVNISRGPYTLCWLGRTPSDSRLYVPYVPMYPAGFGVGGTLSAIDKALLFRVDT